MNERQLKSFIQTRDAGSFSKAARENYISVPALIQQIDLLQEGIGFELFIRSKRGVVLSPGGEKFYTAAKEILRIYQEAIEIGAKENGKTLHFPINSTSPPDFFTKAMSKYTKMHTECELVPVMVQMNDHFDALRKYEIDFSIIAEPGDSVLNGLKYESLGKEKLAFAMSPQNPLSRHKKITLSDLKNQVIVCGNYGYLRYPFETLLKNSGAVLEKLSHEYDVSIKANTMLSNKLVVIHSHWKNSYTDLLTVVESDIDAGCIAFVYRKDNSNSVSNIKDFFIQNIK